MKIKLDTVTTTELPFWALKQPNVESLAASMAEMGLLNPITVRNSAGDEDFGYVVVAGRHRLEAARKLGWTEIEATVVKDKTPGELDLATADENLCRASLSPSEVAAWTAFRKAAYEALYPETGHGRGGKDPEFGSLDDGTEDGKTVEGADGAEKPKAFIEDTAAKTGASRSKVALDAQRGKNIDPKILKQIQGTAWDKGVVLDELSATPKNKQAEKLAEIQARPKGDASGNPKKISAGQGGMPRFKAGEDEVTHFNNAVSHYMDLGTAPIRFEFWNYILLREKERGMPAAVSKVIVDWLKDVMAKAKKTPEVVAKPETKKPAAKAKGTKAISASAP